MNLINKVEIIEKKSKFIAYFYEINNENEVNDILSDIKKEHKKARHFPFAYIYENMAKKSDDKEPSGTAGNPIFFILEKHKLNSHLIVVVRYFGGTKLGSGPLMRAYLNSALKSIEQYSQQKS